VRAGQPQAQLAALRYGFTSQGQLKVESKEEMCDRGVPSPDRADALALAFAADLTPAGPYAAAGRPREGVAGLSAHSPRARGRRQRS
jgi:hypothetical protein